MGGQAPPGRLRRSWMALILAANEILFILQCKHDAAVSAAASLVDQRAAFVEGIRPRVSTYISVVGHQRAVAPLMQVKAGRLHYEGRRPVGPQVQGHLVRRAGAGRGHGAAETPED